MSRGDEPLCALSQEIGSLLPLPEGWPRRPPPPDRVALHGGYAVGDLPDLVERLRDGD